MRCAPQVAGAARDTVAHARSVAGYELASAIDNPVVTPAGAVESNGNFHGAPVGYVLDFLAIPVADLASMSERRTDRMLDVARSRGLPPFLAADAGVDSGHMIAQYTQAAVVSELKRLAVPARWIRSHRPRCRRTTCRWVGRPPESSAELSTGWVGSSPWSCSPRPAQSTCGRRSGPAPATGAVIAALRRSVDGPGPDRFLAPEIEAAVAFVRPDGGAAAESALPAPLG